MTAAYRVQSKPGQEPNKWKVEKFAEIGWDEKFVRDMCELKTILDATLIFDQQREDANNAIMTILTDGLMPAFAELGKIRAFDGKSLPVWIVGSSTTIFAESCGRRIRT